MTVKQLIEHLEKLPPNAEVTYINYDERLRDGGVRETLEAVELDGDVVDLYFS
jgi:hypothetical protein